MSVNTHRVSCQVAYISVFKTQPIWRKGDKIYKKLLQSWEHDNNVEMILKIMLPAIGRLLERVFAENLHEGRWHLMQDKSDVESNPMGFLNIINLLKVFSGISTI